MLGKLTVALMLGATSSAIGMVPAEAVISANCSITGAEPTLSYGNTGLAVRQAQCEIVATIHNAGIAQDGIFGSATLAAVKKVQGCAHIAADGVIGPDTWSVLDHYSSGSSWLC